MYDKCPLLKEINSDGIHLYLVGKNLYGRWKCINDELTFEQDCKNNCGNYKNCGEWL